ncbi:hypothetical protein B0T17DRAFT_111957 [Bombardia bombarda]|uniref:Uncharacterized protein n=1 Tax=Bombardia bombarda TaxID=252184 RepID=A0AA39TRK8_9PEZI|nr:hypothetical protein B0T17DRAFT_111957 [Bombardia bombarda]
MKCWTCTPFLALFRGMRSGRVLSWNWDEDADDITKVWLENLEACGVDLIEYGKTEQAALEYLRATQSGRPRRLVMDTSRSRGGPGPTPWKIVEICGLEYGLKPSDWAIRWDVGPDLPDDLKGNPIVTDNSSELGRQFGQSDACSPGRHADLQCDASSVPLRIPGEWVD